MADTYNPKIVFSGDSSGASSAISRLKGELGGLESLAKKALSFGIGAYTIKSLVDLTKSVIDQGDELNKMSQKTGVAVEELSKYRYISDLSGVSNEALTKGLIALSVGMGEAATGTGATAEEYKKFGINVRNTDGTMKTSGAVLAEWADKFALMPDGVDKTNLAVDIFGKKLGAEMIPMLNLGSAGLKALGDEAQSLGLVMGEKLAKQSEEFNDNLDRMKKLSTAVGIEIAQTMIPALNEYMTQLIDAKKAGLGFMEALTGIGLSDPFKPLKEQISDLDTAIESLRKQGSPLAGTSTLGGRLNSDDVDKQIAALERLKKYYELQDKRQTGDGIQSAEELSAKRIVIENNLQTKLAELAKLHAIAEGKVSADILDDDNKRTAAQIANAQKLREALVTAWNKSRAEAVAAGEAAKKLLEQASDVRQTASDKASAKRRSTLSPEEQQAQIQSEFNSAASSAETNAGLATIAALHGRTENAAKLAAQAAKDAERATKLADQIDDPEAGARAIEQAGEIQAKLLESQAKEKQAQQTAAAAKAAETSQFIDKLDTQITELKDKAAAIKVQADISAAEGAIKTLKTQLDNLKDKTVTVTVNQVGSSDAPLAGASPAAGTGEQFARGGWTGPGGKWQPAGIVHADEFVLRQEVTRQAGAKSFLSLFNQVGMRALQGYANGGLVQNLRIQPISSPARAQGASGTPINLYLDGRQFPVTATPSVAGEMTTLFQREALKRGGRK